MSIEENKDIVRRFNDEVFIGNDPDAVDKYLAPDILNRVTGLRGTDDWKRIIRAIHAFAPDTQFTIEDLIAEGDRVVLHGTWSGTHQGEVQMPWGTIPPSGKRFSVRHVHIYRVKDGKIAEHLAVRDDLALLRQLGATL